MLSIITFLVITIDLSATLCCQKLASDCGQPRLYEYSYNFKPCTVTLRNRSNEERAAQLLADAGRSLRTFRKSYYLSCAMAIVGLILMGDLPGIGEDSGRRRTGRLLATGGGLGMILSFAYIGRAGDKLIEISKELKR